MSAVLVTEAAANSPEWHAARRGGIGASEISAVVGLNPWTSAFHLFHVKKGNLPEPNPENELFYWGHALEPLVANKFEDRHPEAYGGLQVVGIHAHSERPWQLASLDRMMQELRANTGVSIPVEIKTSRFGDGYGRSGTDEIPLYVRCQVQQQMDVFGAPYAWVAALIGGSDYREYLIEANAEDQKTLRDAGAAFWESLQTDDEPPIDCSDSTYEAVRALNPQIDKDAEIEIPADLWEQYLTHKIASTHHESELRGVKSQILTLAGSARFLTFDTEPVLRRQMSSSGTPYLREIA